SRRRHTRFSRDWSSDVCSSDLPGVRITVVSRPFFKPFFDGIERVDFFSVDLKERHKGFFGLIRLYNDLDKLNLNLIADLHNVLRSEERRVGKECSIRLSTCN